MIAFCDCGREHLWLTGARVLCPCGQVLESQTNKELRERKAEHGTRIALIVQRNPLLLPEKTK